MKHPIRHIVIASALMLSLAGCSGGLGLDSLGNSVGSIGGIFGGKKQSADGTVTDSRKTGQELELPNGETVLVEQRASRRILGGGRGSIDQRVQVNKHIWAATLE